MSVHEVPAVHGVPASVATVGNALSSRVGTSLDVFSRVNVDPSILQESKT
jgi:hypothetical protein